ncbi:MAG: hypothetical protein LC798_12690 [Chloroflexi bacterium]|nr:hypothetical protein [Chloroflexota bacterium]
MNFSLDDRRRSIRQYVALGMDGSDDLYDLRVLREEIADDARPVGLVEPATSVGALGNPRTVVEQGGFQAQQTFAVILYPKTDGEPRVARLRADEHAQRLDDVFSIGLVHDDGSELAPPFQVPVWDHAGVAAVGAGRAAVPAEPYGWLTVEDWTIQPIQDPLDDTRWSIVGSLRCSWWQGGRVEQDPVLARSMPGTYRPVYRVALGLRPASPWTSTSLVLFVP